MTIVEGIVLPALVLATVIAAVRAQRGSRQRARISRWCAVAAVDAFLWVISTSGPIGPVPTLSTVLLVVHVVVALLVMRDVAGVSVRSRDTALRRLRASRPDGARRGRRTG